MKRRKGPMRPAWGISWRVYQRRASKAGHTRTVPMIIGATQSFVEPGDFKGVPGLHRRHFERDDTGIVHHVAREPLHDFGGSGFSRLVTKDLITPVFFAPRQQ